MLRRAFRNAGILLTGKAAAGVMQLATVAIAARSLGLTEFGNFSVLLAGMQLLIITATFQSNQAIVRYGVIHLNRGDRSAFQKLIKFGTLLDLGAASVAAIAAFLLAGIVARWAGWDDQTLEAWRLLSLLPLTLAVATPKGLLRLFGRFDLLARHVTVTPFVRLVGAVALLATGGNLTGWIVMWLVAGWVGVMVGAWLGWREAGRRDLLRDMDLSLTGLRRANAGILRFSLFANLHSSLAMMPGHLATFGVGMVLGPQPAGLMKIGHELGTAFAKPVDLINQSVYPDIARLSEASQWKRLRKAVIRSGAAAAGLSAVNTLILLLAGKWLIDLVFGPAFQDAYLLVLLISVAMTFTVSVFAVDPALYALGKPSRPLITASASITVFLVTMFAAFPSAGLYAPGIAYLAAAATTIVCASWWMSTVVPRQQAAR